MPICSELIVATLLARESSSSEGKARMCLELIRRLLFLTGHCTRHLAPLEEGDDGYGVKYASMFSRAANGESTSISSEESMPEQDGTAHSDVSARRRKAPCAPGSSEENSFEEMTMTEIMSGKGDYFPGLIPLIHAYLDHIQCDSVTRTRLTMYLDFVERRASGELVTPATWMRKFVRNHPAYKCDSVVTDEIAYVILFGASFF
jgi:hypothetical protein